MTQVSPDYSITLAGKSLTLDGSFATLRAVQQAFRRDLIDVQASVLDLRQDEIAQLLAAATRQELANMIPVIEARTRASVFAAIERGGREAALVNRKN